jgi:hypothetical protein
VEVLLTPILECSILFRNEDIRFQASQPARSEVPAIFALRKLSRHDPIEDGLVFLGFSYPSHPEFAPGLVLELVLDLMAKISSGFPQIAQVLVASRLGVALFRRQLGHG